jgi:chromosome segregation ATPase
LRAELEGLRNETEFKTLQIAKLTSEFNSRGDMGARLRIDTTELSKDLDIESKNNLHLRSELERCDGESKNLTALHLKQMDQLKTTEAGLRNSRLAVDSLSL